MTFDVLTLGRIGIDLYPEQSGVPLAQVRSFRKLLGGSPTNVAAAAARLALRAAVVTKVGEDGFGAFARAELRRLGVDPRWVATQPGGRTPVAFAELHPPDDFPLLFYRDASAPDLQLRVEDLPPEQVRTARVLWATGGALCAQPSRDATLAALRTRTPEQLTILDLDHRPALWTDPADAAAQARAALAAASVVVGNAGEAAVVVGAGEPEQQAARLLELGPALAIVKLGPDGVLAATAGQSWRVAPIAVEVVNGLGAGDAFGGALCFGLLAGWEPPRAVAFANAAGALVAGRFACAEDMPTAAEVEALLATVTPEKEPA